MMITDFENFYIWVFVVADDKWNSITPLLKHRGPEQ